MKTPKYKQVNLQKALSDIKQMLKNTHDIKQTKDFYNYKGEDIKHHSILATSENIKNDVSKNGAEYHKERGRDLLDIILLKVFQLGYSQAKIIEENDEITKLRNDFIDKMIKQTKQK